MTRRIATVLTVVTFTVIGLAIPVSAQWTVIDPANLAQAVLIAERTRRVYEQLQLQYQVIMRMAQGLRGLDRYRIPGIVMSAHDASRFPFGRAWLEGLNSGDARGGAYARVVVPLQHPAALLDRLPPAARRAFENQFATVEVSDSVATMGGHQVALMRGYHGQLQSLVEHLQRDVLNTSSDYHQLTAVLDKISAGELVARRQDMATNQLLSHALEQLLARNKRQRDTEASTINMQLTAWRDGRAADEAFRAGVGAALSQWRQP